MNVASDGRAAPMPAIVDAHCHIASSEHTPRSFAAGVASNVCARLLSQGIEISADRLAGMYLDTLRDPLCDELVVEMDAAGISRAVLLAADFSYALDDCLLTVEESFMRHYAVLQRHADRFVVFGGVDPRWGRDGIDLFDRAVRDFGFRGFKVYPPCGFSPSAPELQPFYEICAAHRLPVLIHIGPTSPVLGFHTSTPFMVDEAARRFPSVNFILAHAPVAFTDECIMLCRFRPNVWLDVSGFQIVLEWDPHLTSVERLVTCGVTHKVLFGTDWPAFRLQGTQRTFVDAIVSDNGPLRGLSVDDQHMVLSGNVERLLETASVAVA